MNDRELLFDNKMSDAEALMWNVEKDPWLNPSGAMVAILDAPLDFEKYRNRIMQAVAHVPRLRERVVPSFANAAPPTWATDPEFDIDYHLRHISLAGPGSERQLFDLATRLYEDPYDRTRPLWMFVAIDGLEGGRGAVFSKLHHSITDGIGAMRLSERYMELERDAEPAAPVDLGPIIAEAAAAEAAATDGALSATPFEAMARSAGHKARRNMGIFRRALGEVASWTADPTQARDTAVETVGAARSMIEQIAPTGEDGEAGSPLWTKRSRGRHLELVTVALQDVKDAGKTLGGSVNDVFVTAATMGALAYHAKRNTLVEALNISVVVSTRTGGGVGGNSFTPTVLRVSGEDLDIKERLAEIAEVVAERRLALESGGPGLESMAGLAAMLPTSVVTQVARNRAAMIDIATSNMRGAPIATYMSGARVLQTVTMGPVAGTACNMTAVSYNGDLNIGLFIDPAAIDDPADFRLCLEQAYAEIFSTTGVG